MKKNLLTSALSLTIMMSVAGYASAASPFTDTQNSPAKAQIEALASAGIIDGTANQQFSPEGTLTTAQGAALIVRSMKLEIPSGQAADSKTWYSGYFAALKGAALELPAAAEADKAMTKEAFVAHLVQALEKSGGFPMIKLAPVEIADEADLTPEYQGAVQRALHYKLVALDDQGKFNPGATLTRAEAASITYKATELLNKRLDETKDTTAAAGDAASSERWMNLPEGVTPADNE